MTSYTYDADSQLKTVTNASHQTTYKYDAAGELTETDLPNSWTIQRTYDAAGRALEIKSVNGSQTLADTKYVTRDGDGNPVQISRDGNVENYTYDTAGRVNAVCYGAAVSGCSSANLITYSYDTVGNRVSQVNAGTTTTYTYDADDELTQSTTGGTNTSYTYDANGNETSSGTTTFDFNLANQLTEADTPSTTVTYTYDGNGNRLTKSATGTSTAYTWDENNDLPQLATESQGGNVLRSYVYGLDLFAMNSGGTAYYLHTDDLGSTVAVTAQDGSIETTTTYDPYGNVRRQTNVDPSAPTMVLQFAGELEDPETGLYDMRARIYDPATGRFLSQDPMTSAPATATLNNYIYSVDDPLAYGDPSGAVVSCLDICGGGIPPGDGGSSQPPATSGSSDSGGSGSSGSSGGAGGVPRGVGLPSVDLANLGLVDQLEQPSAEGSELSTVTIQLPPCMVCGKDICAVVSGGAITISSSALLTTPTIDTKSNALGFTVGDDTIQADQTMFLLMLAGLHSQTGENTVQGEVNDSHGGMNISMSGGPETILADGTASGATVSGGLSDVNVRFNLGSTFPNYIVHNKETLTLADGTSLTEKMSLSIHYVKNTNNPPPKGGLITVNPHSKNSASVFSVDAARAVAESTLLALGGSPPAEGGGHE